MSLRILIGLLSFSLLFYNDCFSQFIDYTPIKCEGPIPEVFRTSVAVRFPKSRPISTYNDEGKIKKRITSEKERNEYLLDFLLKRGKVLFGDTLTQYVNSVANKLLQNDPELKANLEFYVVRSSEVNAFATSQGMTFVTIGLLSQLENEAQLAFVLSHEISHHEKDHMNQKIAQRAELPQDFDRKKYEGEKSRINILSDFSKDMEFQADSLGFYRLRNAGYDERAALSMLDILQWSFLPIDDVKFNRDFLLFDSLKFPTQLLADTVREIPLFDDEKEVDNGSHPGISRRRTKMSLMLTSVQNKGVYYQLEKSNFQRIRYISQRELVRLQLTDHEFPTALYNAVILYNQEPQSKFLEESIGRALYGCSKFKNTNNTSSMDLNDVDIYGHLFSCHTFISEMKDEEIGFITLRYLYYLENKYHSPDITLMKEDMIRDAVRYFDIESADYVDQMALAFRVFAKDTADLTPPPVSDLPTDTLAVADSDEPESKYDKLRKEKKEKLDAPIDVIVNDSEDYKFYFLAFGDSARSHLKADLITYFEKNAPKSKGKPTYKRLEKGKYPYKLPDSGKVLVIDPYFFKIEKNDLNVYSSQTHQNLYSASLDSAIRKTGYETVNLLSQRYDMSDTELYNTMAMVNDWLEEILHAEDLVKEMVPANTYNMLKIAEAYGAQYVCTSMALHKTTNVKFSGGEWLLATLLYPILPIVIMRSIIPKKELFYYYAMYEVNRGKTLSEYTGTKRSSASKGNYYGNHINFMKEFYKDVK